MKKPITITKLTNGNVSIESETQKYKLNQTASVVLFNKDAVRINDGRVAVELNFNDVTTPSVSSGVELYIEMVTNFFFTDIETRLQNLEAYELVAELTQNIGTNQSGTLTIPQNSSFERGAYPDKSAANADEDSLVAYTGLDGKASGQAAKTVGGAFVFVASLDSGLNYVLTGEPSAASSLYFAVKIPQKYWQSIDQWVAASPDNNIASLRQLIPEETTADKNFVFVQAVPAAVWNVTHNLGKFPAISVVDSANTVVEGDVEHISTNQARLSFSGAFSGQAFFN